MLDFDDGSSTGCRAFVLGGNDQRFQRLPFTKSLACIEMLSEPCAAGYAESSPDAFLWR